MKRLIFLILIISTLSPGAAIGFIELQGLEPNPAQTSQNVNLVILAGGCDTVSELVSVTVDGQEIDVLTSGARNFFPDCIFPATERVFALGRFSIGEYNVTVRREVRNAFGGPEVEVLGALSLTVETPRPIPSIGPFGTLLLIILLLVFGGIRYAK